MSVTSHNRPKDRDLEEWHLNPKINVDAIPSWDGGDDSLIDYFSDVFKLARMGPKMQKGLASWLPMKFSGRADDWWKTLSGTAKTNLQKDWGMFLGAVYNFSITEQWVEK